MASGDTKDDPGKPKDPSSPENMVDLATATSSSEAEKHNQRLVQSLSAINTTLQEIKGNTLATSIAVDDKKTSAEESTEGLKERTAIEKPGAGAGPNQGGKASGKSIGDALISGVKNLFSKALDWAKIFGLVGFGIIFKDKILDFIAGAFEPIKEWVSEWWNGTFLPAVKELDKAINPFSDDKGLFSSLIDMVSDFGTRIKEKLTAMGNAFNTMVEDLTGFSIKDMIFGEEGEDGVRKGGIAGYLDKVGEGFVNFGTSIGILDKDGNVSLGTKLGLGAIASALLMVKGPGLIIKGLFSALGSATTGLLTLAGIKKPKTPTTTTTGTQTKGGPTAGTGTTTKVAKPGDVVTSKSGNKVYAGADGKPTSVKVGDKKGLADIKKAAAKGPAPGKTPSTPKTGGGTPKAGGMSKFPRMKTLLGLGKKIPMIGTLFAAGDLIRILNQPGDVKSKVDDIAGLLGGLGGSVLGAAAGATIGSVVPLAGTAIGGLAGGIGGYFVGDMLAQGLAQWLLGQKVDAFPGMINDMINDKKDPVAGATPPPDPKPAVTQTSYSPKPNVPSVAPGGAQAGVAAAKTATVNNDAVQKAVADAKAANREGGQQAVVLPPPPAPPAKGGDKTDTIIIEMGKTKADITRATIF